MNHNVYGILLVLLSAVMLSFKGILAKLAYAEGIEVMELLMLRMVFSLPMFFAFAVYKQGLRGIRQQNTKNICYAVFAGFIGYYLSSVFDFTALSLIDVSIERLILFSFPAFVVLFNSLIERKAPPKQHILAFIIAQCGMYFVVGSSDKELLEQNIVGAVWALAAAIGFAIYVIINQQIAKKMGATIFTFYAILSSFVFMALHYVAFYEVQNLWSISLYGNIIVFLIAIFCTFLPLLLFTEGISRIGGSRASIISAIGPFVTIVAAFTILDEKIYLSQLIGGIMIVSAILVLEKKRKNLD